MDKRALWHKLQTMLSPERFQHSLGVQETARTLAYKYGADAAKASLAGIVHDCARDLSRNNLLKKAKAFGIVVDEIEALSPELLHAPVGAAVAEHELGISDPEVLSAIACHTTGKPGMSTLEKIIYLADYIEPHRSFPGVEQLREIAEIDLDKAVLAALEQTLRYLMERRMFIHTRTVEARNAFLLVCQDNGKPGMDS